MPACSASSACDEARAACLSNCDLDPDADGDGHASLECGGGDCDDGDPRRYPGNTEICDSVGRDEDCNWEPFGPEADGDGHSPAICCNLAPDGSLRCGADCDDTSAEINPDAPESCNGVDDDCDGVIDEGDLSAACGGIAYSIHGCVAGAYDGTVDFDGTVLATDPDSHAFLLRLDP